MGELNHVKEADPNDETDDGKEGMATEQLFAGTDMEKISGVPEMVENEPVMKVIEDLGDNLDKYSHTICEDKENEEKCGLVEFDSVVKKETPGNPDVEDVKKVLMKCIETDVFLKEEILDTIVGESITVDDNLMDGLNGDVNNSGSLEGLARKSSIDEELKIQPAITSPLLSLPEFLTEQTTSGILEQQLSTKFAILTLDSPAGTKALLHCGRLLVDKGMVPGQVLRVSARRVEGFEEFDYQVTHAGLNSGLAMDEEGCVSKQTDLGKLAEEKLDNEMLDKELEMFKEK